MMVGVHGGHRALGSSTALESTLATAIDVGGPTPCSAAILMVQVIGSVDKASEIVSTGSLSLSTGWFESDGASS